MKSTMMHLLLFLLMAAVINSFSPMVINTKNNGAAPSLMQLHARNNQNKNTTPGRTPPNRRTSIKWVIQGVEKCLADEDQPSPSKHGGKPSYCYRRRVDASLVDALYLMANAKSQKDLLDAEKRIKVLLKNPSEFPLEVTERVIRATSVAGLSVSVDLLRMLLRGDNVTVLPSSIAYISVLSFLRKIGRIDRLEETLAELANVSRRIQMKNPTQSGIDIVAFNTYLGAVCDAAVAGRPFSSSFENDESEFPNIFNFTNFNNTLDQSSSEKYLYKGLNLLRGDVARKKYALDGDPDIYSFNSLLTAVAKCSKPGLNLLSITDSCLLTMKKKGIECDTLTYNARIQAAIAANEEDRSIQLIDELLLTPTLNADRYTINLSLMPFVHAGRKGQMLALMKDFYEMNAGRNNSIIVSAFEAFLNTLVQNDEVGLARDVFDAFFLSIPKDRVQMTGIRPNPTTRHFNILLGGYSKAGDALKAFELFDKMLEIGASLDGFTVSSLMTHSISPEKITSLLAQIETERVILNPASYRSIIGAYGNAGDAASACFMFEEMGLVCQKRGRGTDSWNVLLGALARGCTGDRLTTELDIYGSIAAKRGSESLTMEKPTSISNDFISLVDGKTCLDASFTILDLMRNGNQTSPLLQTPKPNSQTYCLVASALSGFGTSAPHSDRALTLFRDAMNQGGVTPDGRFLNAVLRCFGDDIEAALAAWKTDIGPAAASQQRNGKINLQQAYNGLMHVCGRALRPDIGVRVAYAMNKAGVEPTEVSLNCYKSGKRVALEGMTGISKRALGLTNQYENLLSVECTKYNTRKWDKSKRRAGDKKIRIILQQ